MNQLKTHIAYLFICIFTLSLTTVQAQRITTAQQDGTTKYIKFYSNQKASLQEAKSILEKELQLHTDDELRLKSESTDQLGHSHTAYQQFYKGIKVENGKYTIHAKNGKVELMNGEFLKIKKMEVTPDLTEQQALSNALNFINAEKYMWESMPNELWAQETEPRGTFMPEGELVIIQNRYAADRAQQTQPVLVYKFDVYAEKPLSRDHIYVNAKSGEIVYVNPIIKTCFNSKDGHCGHNHNHEKVDNGLKALAEMLAAGTAATRYSGSQTIETTTTSGGYRLREYTRGNGIETYDMNESTNYNSAVDFVDNDNNWTAAEWDNSNKDNAALDAHWGAAATYDYFNSVHNRNSYDNNGAVIKSYVHYDSNYDNAFWNGSVMTYGDGSGTYFDALTSLDVAAHEIGHAVCSSTADLAYQRESGALNEGYSDIWGAAVEYFAAPNKDTWLIGEDIERRSGHAALRSMSDPNSENQPDTYGGTYWQNPNCGVPLQTNDYCGVHTNSGVLNYWFYLLTEGGSGTNDIGNAFSVTGIGIVDAAKIAYRTEAQYLSANSTFADARTFSIQSAVDLFGAGSAAEIATTNAFHAVGVGSAYGGGGGGSSYCASQGNNWSDEWISNVQIGSFSNNSGAAGYTDHTSQTVNVDAGSTYSVTLTPGFSGTAYTEFWKIWIDYNEDNDFEDAGELVFSPASSNAAVSGNMTIDANYAGVTTRMRISMKYNAAQTSCESFSYGEVEDYTISIGGGAPSCDTPTGLSISNITTNSATASWNAITGAGSYDVRFRQIGTSNWTSGNITGTAANMTGLSASTNYEVQVRANCTGASSDYTSSSTFTTDAPASTGCSGGIAPPYAEGFESGLGGWTQGTGDDFDWTRRSGSTPSSNTGPSAAATGSFYVYTESSDPNYPSKVTILNSPCFNLSGETDASFNFAYHMYGASNMGGLVLEASTNGSTWTNIWSRSGNQGNAWATANVDMAAYLGGSVQLRFVGTTGSTWQGDMAIDDISLTTGPSCYNMTLSITFDNYPEETSWTLSSGGSTVQSGGTYGNQADGSTLVINMCEAPGCYDFTMSDSYGDGICCSYGNGSYTLTDGNGNTLASGGSFGSSETTNVCIGGASIMAFSTPNEDAGNIPTEINLNPEFVTSKLHLYPNPTVDLLKIDFDSEIEGNGHVRIFDMLGKQILIENKEFVNGQNNFQLNLNDLNKGTFILEIQVGEIKTNKRFVVLK